MARFNLHRAELRADEGNPPAFNSTEALVAEEIGGEHLGGSMLEIPPGGRGWPYHWEAAQEEWLVVLSGTPTLRTPGGEEDLREGDVVCLPCGPEGAHAVHNASDAPCRILMLSSRDEVNVTVYPDSGKVGVRTPWVHPNFPEAAAVDYWEGE